MSRYILSQCLKNVAHVHFHRRTYSWSKFRDIAANRLLRQFQCLADEKTETLHTIYSSSCSMFKKYANSCSTFRFIKATTVSRSAVPVLLTKQGPALKKRKELPEDRKVNALFNTIYTQLEI